MKKQDRFPKRRRGAVLVAPSGKARITIQVDSGVLAWFRERVRSAGGGTYGTLINLALRDHVARDREAIDAKFRRERAYERARRRALRDLRKPRSLGTHGKITWTRDELHERHPEKKAK